MRPEVHVGEVDPGEEGLSGFRLAPNEVLGALRDVVVDRLHPLLCQRPGVLDDLLPDSTVARVLGRVVHIGRLAIQDAARPVFLSELGVRGVVGLLGLFLRVQVVKTAVELVEPVNGGQELVAVAQVILAKVAGRIAQGLEQLGDRRVFGAEALLGGRHADLAQPRSENGDWPVMKDERPAVQL